MSSRSSRSTGSRTTSVGGVISLLGAFLAAAMVMGLLLAGLLMPAVGATGALARGGVDLFNDLPSEFTASPLSQQSRILAADGTVIATPMEDYRVVVKLDQVAPIMRKAQVAIEDHRFYDHGGIDLQGVFRQVLANLRSGTTTGGASSLTQQYVKISLQYAALAEGNKEAAKAAVDQNYIRKLKELKYAITLEKKMTKDQILENYLNLVYYGDRAYGVEAASRHYFSIPASKLSLSQAAMLAGLTQNPGTTDPINFPDKALERRNVVLDRMLGLNVITQQEHDAAKARTLKQDLKPSSPPSTCVSSPYPYWCDFAINYVEQMPELGKTVAERRRLLYRGGLTIKTTLDTKLQKIVQTEVTRQVPIGDKSQVGAAAYVEDPKTGKVLAFAQNTTYTIGKQTLGKTGVNWALDTKYGGSNGFQFGSTAKAFALVTAMENGLNTESSIVAKGAGGNTQATYKPSEFHDACKPGGEWKVYNDSPFAGGKITLMKATAESTNTAFVALAQQVGTCKVRDTLTRLGLHTAGGDQIPKYAPAVILGAAEVSPQGVAGAYSTLSNDGKRCPMTLVTEVSQGAKKFTLPANKCEQVITPDVARATTKILAYNVTNGSGKKAELPSGQVSAGKTGTSDRNNESWYVGYTPQLVTAVWVGTPDDGNKRNMVNLRVGDQFIKKMHGASLAAPIWRGIMSRALDGDPLVKFIEPSDKLTHGEMVSVPNVGGLSVAQANDVLQQAGFTSSVIGTRYSNYRSGTVASTDPYGRAAKGSMVGIYISRGPEPVNNPPANNPPVNNPPVTTVASPPSTQVVPPPTIVVPPNPGDNKPTKTRKPRPTWPTNWPPQP